MIRLAVLADIHGNRRALEAVLFAVERLACDDVIDLGDCLSGPLEAAATAGLLMAKAWKTVRGNHDRQLLEGSHGASDRAARAQLDAAHEAWLRSLPPSLAFEIAGTAIYACHATPASDKRYLLEEVRETGVFLKDPAAELAGIEASLILTGHSHLPRVVSLVDGRTVVNPGSVGLPAYDDDAPFVHYMEVGSPHARFATIDFAPGGGFTVAHHAVAYDHLAAAKAAAANGRPDWEHALRTGFALRPVA